MNAGFRRLLLTTAVLLTWTPLSAVAGPNGASVVGGTLTINGAGTGNVTINQTSNSAIINWNTFNILNGEIATFNQLNSSSVILNRVTGGLGPSTINGTLNANGQVFLINRDGVLFGRGAVVNTSGFLATTNDIKNEDFLAGRYNFTIPGRSDASIVNHGTITASNGGFAALVAPGVRNTGTITATLGTVSLAAGNVFTLDFYGDRLVTLAVTDSIADNVKDVGSGKTLKSLVSNSGKLSANGGRVELTAAAARAVVNSVINNRGVIEANSIGTRNGMIVLGGATGSSKPAGAPTQTVRISGRISAAGKAPGITGGTVVITGEDIRIANAQIDASGNAGGGKVLIGGDWGGGNPNTALVNNPSARLESFTIANATTVSVDSLTTINASSTGTGNGGKVVLWSEQQTTFAGTILANGGAAVPGKSATYDGVGTSPGYGGFVETSSHGVLNFTGTVDTRAAPGGTAGTLLLDPRDIDVVSTGSDTVTNNGGTITPNQDSSTIQVSTLEAALANGNVILTTGGTGSPGSQSGDITFDIGSVVTWSQATTLTLSAYRDITFIQGAGITSTGAGSLILRADNSGTGTGTVNFYAANGIDFRGSTGTVSIYYDPTGNSDHPVKYTLPTNFSSDVFVGKPSQLSTYMLVNNASDLNLFGTNSTTLASTYALGKDIDATGFAGFSSGTTFKGILDGNGGLGATSTISNLTLSLNHAFDSYGLFPFIGTNGIVRNLTLANVNVTAGADIQMIGALAGQNFGTISNVGVSSGTVSGGTHSGIGAGGLVGQNDSGGSITGSNTNVTIALGDATGLGQINYGGGLVGINQGTIGSSFGTGNVTGGNNSYVGGVVGENFAFSSAATIDNSYATGTVTGAYTVGGLAGANFTSGGSAAITNSHASGNVVLNAGGFSAGGLVGQNEGRIENSHYDTGTVSAAGSTTVVAAVGGLIGTNNAFSNGNAVITNSYSAGNLSVANFVTAGGLVGENVGGSIANSYATGNLSGTFNNSVASSELGGLVGSNTGTISNSFATGNVTGTFSGTAAGGELGGLVGDTSGQISNSYATGNVSGTLTAPGGTSFAFLELGGLAGGNSGTISSSHATGSISGTFSVGNNTSVPVFALGGLVGENESAISNSYATGGVSVGGTIGSNNTDFAEAVGLGGLAGLNIGTIANSYATGAVGGTIAGSANGFFGLFDFFGGFGGLVGVNIAGSISNSYATGNVSGNGVGLAVGGLAGVNVLGTITDSQAFGSVTLAATGKGNALFNDPTSWAGGLVGYNLGTITSTSKVSLSSSCTAGAAFSCASGAVNIGSGNVGGGLVGQNSGTITQAFASGSVGGSGDAYLTIGGLVGENHAGTIQNSFATGAVTAGDFSFAGGLVGVNDNCGGCLIIGFGQGFPVSIGGSGSISGSGASGNVTVGSSSFGGGLAGANVAAIQTSAAFGAVSGGASSFLGGLAGVNTFDIDTHTVGTIINSSASGAVSSTGPSSLVGGLVGANDVGAKIVSSNASGAVTGTSSSFLGGLAGVNFGTIQDSFTAVSSTVTGTGSSNYAGGLVGLNLGLIDPSHAAGNVTSGANSFVGGLVGANGAAQQNLDGTLLIGTISSDSTGSGSVSGGAGSMVGSQVGQNYPTSGLPDLSLLPGCGGDPTCGFTLFNPNPTPTPTPTPIPTPTPNPTPNPIILVDQTTPALQAQVINNLVSNVQVAALTPADVVTIIQPPPPPAAPPAPQPQPTQTGVPNINQPIRLDVGAGRFFYLPPPQETRLVQNEVVLQMPCNVSQDALNAVLQQRNLSVAGSQCLGNGLAVYHMNIGSNQTLDSVIRALAVNRIVVAAQANYVYTTMQDPASVSSKTQDDDQQYILKKLQLNAVHQLYKGTNIPIAVIDSQIDINHPDLQGAIVESYDAVGGAAEPPHPHGTGMAGAISSHRTLTGTAPAAHILAVHAFSSKAATAESTTYSIIKGLDWATSKGVRVINMSFAGPKDPTLERALKLAADKGIVLIAAAGNAGPKSPPLYPGADPNVIAVTATDENDKLFSGANRGKYIAVAAPGVDIVVPAPDGTYQETTGTSVASAEVSGIVALLLERNPDLKPADIRRILTTSAKRLGIARDRDDDYGSGLVDPAKALQEAGPNLPSVRR